MSHGRLILISVLKYFLTREHDYWTPYPHLDFSNRYIFCISLWNSWGLSSCRKSWQSNIPFLRYCRFVSLDTLRMGMAKRYMHLSKIKIISHVISKILQTWYFGYIGHAWPYQPKRTVSTYGQLWCLPACTITNFIPNFFFEIDIVIRYWFN